MDFETMVAITPWSSAGHPSYGWWVANWLWLAISGIVSFLVGAAWFLHLTLTSANPLIPL